MLQRWQAGSGAHGEYHTVVWGNDWDDKKNENKSRCCLRQLWRDKLGNNTNQKQVLAVLDVRDRECNWGMAQKGCYSIVLVAIVINQIIKQK